MSVHVTSDSGRISAHDVRVWDPLVRLIHWGVALTVLINSFSDAESSFHEWVGYTAMGLVAVRLLWGLVGSHTARFSAFPPNPFAAVDHVRKNLAGKGTVHLSHNPLGALMVYNIWATMIILGVTGYMMGTIQFFGVDWVENVHEVAYDWLITSIVLHVGGVLFDTWLTKVPLAKAMVTGRKTIPDTATIE
jgi:cytochrome b